MFRTSLARVAGPMRRAAAVADGDAGTKLNFSLLLPHKPVYDNAMVDQVTIPGATGVLGVLKGHMKTMADLQAGVLSVQNDGVTETFFVSGGFAFVEGDKAMVAAVEAVSIDDLDSVAVEKGLTAATQALATANDEGKAEAQSAVDTYRAMQYALSL